LSRISSSSDLHNSHREIKNWIAFDLEWEFKAEAEEKQRRDAIYSPNICNSTSGTSFPPTGNEYRKIITFGHEDVFGNRNVLDISGFRKYPDPDKEFLTSVRQKLLQYRYCFAWGSKATKHLDTQNNILEGVNGDLVVLDINLKQNGIPSIIRYDRFTGKPSIRSYGAATTDCVQCSQNRLLNILFSKINTRASSFRKSQKPF
jgi:hypothetical protein